MLAGYALDEMADLRKRAEAAEAGLKWNEYQIEIAAARNIRVDELEADNAKLRTAASALVNIMAEYRNMDGWFAFERNTLKDLLKDTTQ